MEEANQQQRAFDHLASLSSPGERAVGLHNVTDQPVSSKDERVVSANPSPDAAILSAPINTKDQNATTGTSGVFSNIYPFNGYATQEQGFYYGGYDNGTATWDEQSNYVNANNLHVIPSAMYNDNSSLFFPSGHGFDAQMGYGPYSPIPSPISSVMIDGQLYSQHQIPVSPSYYQPAVSPGLPHVTSALPVSQSDLVVQGSSSQESLIDHMLFGQGSGFYVPFGSFGGGELSGNGGLGFYKYQGDFGSGELLSNQSSSLDASRYISPMTSATMYQPPMGIFGSYEQNVTQQQPSFQGLGLGSGSSNRRGSFNYSGGSGSRWETRKQYRPAAESGWRRERDRESASISSDLLGLSSGRNQGPRAANMKSNSPAKESSSSVVHKDNESVPALQLDQYNRHDFVTDYENARFFVIKSFSEDNVHKSIKYNVWASTTLGNKKLDAAFREAKEKGNCPVFLLFSVNASGQFCGVAEMLGTVDFENDADYWQQDRWSGQFPVKWHIIKDVPNSRFRHILLETNENKPVTHSRDSQEVKLEQGIEMLRIFKSHDADTSLLDDFTFYDEREKVVLQRKVKQHAGSTAAVTPSAASVNHLSGSLAGTLNLDGSKKVVSKTEL